MFCPSCGRPISDESSFCTYCGTTIGGRGSSTGTGDRVASRETPSQTYGQQGYQQQSRQQQGYQQQGYQRQVYRQQDSSQPYQQAARSAGAAAAQGGASTMSRDAWADAYRSQQAPHASRSVSHAAPSHSFDLLTVCIGFVLLVLLLLPTLTVSINSGGFALRLSENYFAAGGLFGQLAELFRVAGAGTSGDAANVVNQIVGVMTGNQVFLTVFGILSLVAIVAAVLPSLLRVAGSNVNLPRWLSLAGFAACALFTLIVLIAVLVSSGSFASEMRNYGASEAFGFGPTPWLWIMLIVSILGGVWAFFQFARK